MRRTPLVVAGLMAGLALATLLFPGTVPLGVVLLGALLGTGTGLMAVGLVLTYRTTRILNFAYGAMATVGAGAAAGLAVGRGVPWLVAAPIGVANGILVGALIERVVIRRFRDAPRLVLTVATIGIAQIIPGVAPYLPQLFDVQEIIGAVETPFQDIEVHVRPMIFNGNDLALLVVVPIVLLGL
ncbi:MAG TPA: hypothetical protein VF743_10310, partial [Acidimicrobiales bacterium]